MTPSDTNLPRPHTPTNPNDPCTCGHRQHAHAMENRHNICLICTTRAGGCQGFTPEPTAAERDAFMAGFVCGLGYGIDTPGNDWETAAERAYTQWIEDGEDA